MRYPTLSADVRAFDAAASQSSDESARRAAALDVVRDAVRAEWGPDAIVNVFGSVACGTTLPSSDVDCAVTGAEWGGDDDAGDAAAGGGVGVAAAQDARNRAMKPAMIRAARRLADRLRAMSRSGRPVSSVLAITRARVPVVRTTIRSVGVDVVFGQTNGVAAAAWTKARAEAHAELAPLARVSKAFLRGRGMGDVGDGGVGSHAVTVMLAAYLDDAKRMKTKATSGGGGGGGGGEERADEEEEEGEEDGEIVARVDGDGDGDDSDVVVDVDVGGLIVGFMRACGAVDVRSDVFTTSPPGPGPEPVGWREKPTAWMTRSELSAARADPSDASSDAAAAAAAVAEPPRLGVRDPLAPERNLAAGSHKAEAALRALGEAGEALARMGPARARLDAVVDVEAALRERPGGGDHGRKRPAGGGFDGGGGLAKSHRTSFPAPDI